MRSFVCLKLLFANCSLLPFFLLFLFSISLSIHPSVYWIIIGNHSQISRAIVAIRVMDINDNAPEFATEYEAFLCENGKPGQVRKEMTHSSKQQSITFLLSVLFPFLPLLPCNHWLQWIIAYLFRCKTTEVGVETFFSATGLPRHGTHGANGKWAQSGLIRGDHNSRRSFMSSSRWHNAVSSQKSWTST